MANYKRKPRKRILGKENEEITRAFAVEMDENPELTPKQEAFVYGLLEGKTVLQAYWDAGYSRNYKNEKVASIQAFALKRKPAIQAAIRLGQKAALDKRPLTVEQHLADLARLRELAVDSAQIAAGVQAETARGKASGLYEERLRVTVGISDEALLSQLAQLLSPEAVAQIAHSLVADKPMIETTAIDITERDDTILVSDTCNAD